MKLVKWGKHHGVLLEIKDSNHEMLNLLRESQGHIHSFQLSWEIVKKWNIFLVMESSIGFSMQKGKELAFHILNKNHILENWFMLQRV